MSKLPNIDRLREALDYNPVTGGFFWKIPGPRRLIGANAGGIGSDGYWVLCLDYCRLRAHRAAWAMVHGYWPASEIDHADGDPLNNRLANLRLSNRSHNMQNMRKAKASGSTGLLGVCAPRRGRYRAKIELNGHQRYLGTFDSAEEAHEAYLLEKRRIHAGCTI